MTSKNLKHGFELQNQQRIAEINSDAFVYEHTKSGAKLIFLKNEDKNKTFQIAFRTPPEDNTGCPHILEHCVLNGSEHYPSINTFTELSKGSLKTFLNAMTYPDKTVYPIASTNDKDFINLMDVYLDAVLFPNIYKHPEIFYQEGWHYEMKGEDTPLNIRGVVYNEMKGAFSSPEGVLYRYCQQMQFPDNQYRFESGGDPDEIPQLSYESFIAFHKKHYHPSNSMIILFGDMDIDAVLKVIDGKYLSHFEKTDIKLEIPIQKAFSKAVVAEKEYPISPEDKPERKHLFAMNWTYGLSMDARTQLGISILADVLMNSPASPLKQKIIASGLVEDSFASQDLDCQQATLTLFFKHLAQDSIPQLTRLVMDELNRLVKEGIDSKLLEASINNREFQYRELQMSGFPQGFYYSSYIMHSWFYGGDPFVYLSYDQIFSHLREGCNKGLFENLIQEVLIKNKHHSQISLKPVPGLNEKRDEEQKAELEKHRSSLQDGERKELIAFNQSFEAWQKQPEKQEELDLIPSLSLKEINPNAEVFVCEPEIYKEFTLLKHPVSTNGVLYLKSYFDLAHAEEEDLPWISLYTYLCGKISTKHHSFEELANEINIHTGGINLTLSLINDYQDPDRILPKLMLSAKALSFKTTKMLELSTEMALHTTFSDVDRIKALIREYKSRLEMYFSSRGDRVAVTRMLNPLSQLYHWKDLSSGLGMYHFLCKLEKNLDTGVDSIIEELEWIQKTFLNRQNLIISLTSDRDSICTAFQNLDVLISELPAEAYAPVENIFSIRDFNEGIYAPFNVQYVAKGGNFFRKGYSYTGKLRVLNNILENEYLYQNIRVQGGAYGAFSGFELNGYQYFCSYRDPNLDNTLLVYDNAGDFIRNFKCSKWEFDRYIIGVISDLDYPFGPETKAGISDSDFITDFKAEDRQQIRNEVLSTKLEDLAAYADMLDAIMAKNHYCAVGNEHQIKASAELFDNLTPLYE